MSQTETAHRYAKALFALSEEEDSLYPVYISFQEIGAILKERNELKVFIQNPLFSREERAPILQRTFDGKVPKLLLKFFMFLNEKNRLNILGHICESFDELYLEKNNQMKGALETSFSLQEDQKQGIQQKLHRNFQKEVFLDCQIKPELLGGFRLLVAGMLFDGSVKSRLEQFRQKVSA